MQNEQLVLILLILTLSVALTVPLVLFVRTIRRRHQNSITLSRYESQRPTPYACPYCRKPMKPGYVLTNGGIHWFDTLKRQGWRQFELSNAIENTVNLSMRIAGNGAWHCPDCHLVLIDHRQMVKRD